MFKNTLNRVEPGPAAPKGRIGKATTTKNAANRRHTKPVLRQQRHRFSRTAHAVLPTLPASHLNSNNGGKGKKAAQCGLPRMPINADARVQAPTRLLMRLGLRHHPRAREQVPTRLLMRLGPCHLPNPSIGKQNQPPQQDARVQAPTRLLKRLGLCHHPRAREQVPTRLLKRLGPCHLPNPSIGDLHQPLQQHRPQPGPCGQACVTVGRRGQNMTTTINHTNYRYSHVMYEHGKIQIHPITPITMYKSNQSTEFGNNPSPHYPAMSRILPKRPKYWAYQLYQINDTSNPYADLTTYWTTYPRPTENSQHTKPSQTPKSFDESPCITAHNCSNIPETKKTRGIVLTYRDPQCHIKFYDRPIKTKSSGY